MFVEPSDSTSELPDSIYLNGRRIRFTGSFYEGEGRPLGYYTEGVEEGRVFRYTSFKVLTNP